jgi:hypothetical protein
MLAKRMRYANGAVVAATALVLVAAARSSGGSSSKSINTRIRVREFPVAGIDRGEA